MSENVSTEESGHRPFDELPLTPAMLANLAQLEYLTMTPIQAASLPWHWRGGFDCPGQNR
jgi:superfamily II DNA/RNA helicase